ncbi:MAG: 1,4-alpha-glucan branching protein GlgB [Clostridia bacterium]|jgi:1,4-alpha-glucan branching enzyme|nr:1,4-alpha-glucan branching protein GlgB [Clostridia bacterium]
MESDARVIEKLKNFHNGEDFNAYDFFGCHKIDENTYAFRVWAPHAVSVTLSGNFCGEEKRVKASVLPDGESYQAIANACAGDTYNYVIETRDGRFLTKADPYAYFYDSARLFSAVVCDLQNRSATLALKTPHDPDGPINIYEVNLLSWKRHDDNSYYTYSELCDELVPYVRDLGYTHVEFMPVTEFPFDGSWGYQVTGYFAVTSRLGSPSDFKRLVDEFHRHGIKVILDWVPAHFPKDEWGLYEFDGQPLYECPLWDRMEHDCWGTRRFDYGRGEVDSFLLSSAYFFFDVYGIDGLRVDAVASMIYLDYDRRAGDFTPNAYGDNRNLEGINFIKKFNRIIKTSFPGAITVAEESTAFPKVTGTIEDGGLGFDYKWNMGWMNDVLFYCKQDPYFRNYHHDKMTFSLVYAFSEKFILPLSHDEVVHVKGSIVNKMPGSYDDKFAGERLLLGYSYAHPGKKLNFMGYEVAQFKEWDYDTGLDLFLAKQYEKHSQMRRFVKDINGVYRDLKPLHEIDFSWRGFEWLVVDDKFNNLFAFSRYSKHGETLVAILNFSGVELKNYKIGINKGKYRVILNTDDKTYGGNGALKKKIFNTVKQPEGQKEYSLIMNIPRLTCLYLIKEN